VILSLVPFHLSLSPFSMSATPNPIGIKSARGYTLCHGYDRTKTLQKRVALFDLDNKNVKNEGFDPVSEISLRGEGDRPAALAAMLTLVAGTDITGLTGGKLIVKSSGATAHADKNNEWEASLKHLPSA